MQVGLGHLDVVAEIVREPDLQAADSRALLLGALQLGEPRPIVGGQRAEAVQLRVVPGADHAALLDVRGKLVGQPAAKKLAQRGKFAQPAGELGEARALAEGGELGPDARNLRERVPDTAKFPGIAQAVLEPPEDPRDVPDRREQLAERGKLDRLGSEFPDQRLAARDFHPIQPGGQQPALEQPGTGGGPGPVDCRQQGAVAGAAD